MNNRLKCILILFSLFFFSISSFSQTLTADTLAKYHVSKILTYKLDSTGNKILEQTRLINKQGLVFEKSIQIKEIVDTILHNVFIDTMRYSYDSTARPISSLHTSTIVTFYPLKNEEKISCKQSTTFYRYGIFFIMNPFSNKKIKHIYTSKHKKIAKSYENGSRVDYAKYISCNRTDYLKEKYYTVFMSPKPTIRKNSCVKHPKKLARHRSKYRKCTFLRKYKRNKFGDIIEENVKSIFYYKKRLNKPSINSYTYTYEYTYKDSFISSCKKINNSINIEDVHFYEYITTP